MTSAHKTKFSLLLIGLLVFVGSAHVAFADYTISTPSGTNDTQTYGYNSSFEKTAQKFTTIGSGSFTQIDVCLLKYGSGNDTYFQVQTDSAGAPSGTVVASTTISSASVSGSPGLVGVSISGTLSASTDYWLVYQTPSLSTSNHNDYCGNGSSTSPPAKWFGSGAWGGDQNNQYITIDITEGAGPSPSDDTATTSVDSLPSTIFYGFLILMAGTVMPIWFGLVVDRRFS